MSSSGPSTVTVFVDGTLSSESISATTEYPPNNTMNSTSLVMLIIGIGMAILILVLTGSITVVLLYFKKSTQPKPKSDYDSLSYSTLCRGDTQQQQTHTLQVPIDLYDQIQLSPSTGQAEPISKAEIENINTLSSHQIDISISNDTEHKITVQSNVSTSEQPTYATVNKEQIYERNEVRTKLE